MVDTLKGVNNYDRFVVNLFGTTSYTEFTSEKEKLEEAFLNPALLKVVKLQCDLFSLGEIKVVDRDTREEIENDPLDKLLNNPNKRQTSRQLKWDYAFRRMMGTANVYVYSKIPENKFNQIYVLDNSKMIYPQEMIQRGDKLLLSASEQKQWNDYLIEYRYNDGSNIKLKNGDILKFHDLTNSTGEWFKSPSVITALRKVLANSENALDAKNINLHLAGRVMVSGKVGEADVNQPMMGDNEKLSIEDMVKSSKNVHAVKSQIQINRFIEDIDKLKLDDSFRQDYFTIGSMFGIPKDVLELYEDGSTYENQIRAMQRHVDYTLQPQGNDLVNGLENHFGYGDTNKDVTISWQHLNLSQYAEMERAEKDKTKAETFDLLVNQNGLDPKEVGQYLGFEFENYGSRKTDTET